MSSPDDRLARLEATVEQLAQRIDRIADGDAAFDQFDRPANMYPPTSDR